MKAMTKAILLGGAALALLVPAAAGAQQAQTSDTQLDTVTVVGTSPMPGTGVDENKVPTSIQTVSSRDLAASDPGNLAAAAADRLASVNLSDEAGSPDQPDFDFRGFTASPMFGEAQGLAVYQNGVRQNEPFGDTVDWDLIPEFAIDRLTVQSSNPVFGLNALGGAVELEMKNGFTFSGRSVTATAGSFGKAGITGEFGQRIGDYGVYAGSSADSDDGYRQHSPATLRRLYADIGRETDRTTLHLSFGGAWNDVRAVGPTPVELLAQEQTSVFTYPQRYDNRAEHAEITGSIAPTDTLSISDLVYFRHIQKTIVDGNTTDAVPCSDNGALLCLGGDTLSTDALLYDTSGNTVATPATDADQALGEIDTSFTNTTAVGDTLQTSFTTPVFGHGNILTAGFAFDHADTTFASNSILGILQPNLLVTTLDTAIDQSFNPTAPENIEPIALDTTNNDYGLYASDTVDLTSRLALTLNGRYNLAFLNLNDLRGGGLSGDHRYARFNPGGGLAYRFLDDLTGYVSYAEANRTPTPGELGCANPSQPCALGAFLVSDPNLAQVVSRTIEGGFRGHFTLDPVPGRFNWNIGIFRTENFNDIQLVSTPLNGYGYFQNVGQTRRQGVETKLSWQTRRVRVDASYSLIDATYRTPLSLSSDSPAADANGLITVQPGDRLPLVPRHRITLSGTATLTDTVTAGADLRLQSGSVLVGDNSDQEPQLPGFYRLDLHAGWQITRWLELSGEIDNVTGEKYYTYGAFTQLDGLPAAYAGLSNPRTYSPAAPRAFYTSLKASF
jgi:iron complex outermembrane receptor protein